MRKWFEFYKGAKGDNEFYHEKAQEELDKFIKNSDDEKYKLKKARLNLNWLELEFLKKVHKESQNRSSTQKIIKEKKIEMNIEKTIKEDKEFLKKDIIK